MGRRKNKLTILLYLARYGRCGGCCCTQGFGGTEISLKEGGIGNGKKCGKEDGTKHRRKVEIVF